MAPVNRCIAVAAHGRRCQQTTYRGGPYCWHHTQSRKVWKPSRVTAGKRPPVAQPEAPVDVVDLSPSVPPIERIAEVLSEQQLAELADFLDGYPHGTFRIEKANGEVVRARPDRMLPYPVRRRRATPL